MKEILESVEYLHKNNIIHRDLKPENILITNVMNGRMVKIGDYTIADVVSSLEHDLVAHSQLQRVTTTTSVDYSAPETRKTDLYDMMADVYSLGVIMKELFSLETQL
jgi:serine/threonine-protein kinase